MLLDLSLISAETVAIIIVRIEYDPAHDEVLAKQLKAYLATRSLISTRLLWFTYSQLYPRLLNPYPHDW